MRPHEVDYASRAKHYIDLVSGEILAGKQDYREYIKSATEPDQVQELGPVLRFSPQEVIEHRQEPLPVRDWPIEKYISYGQWLKFIVPPPERAQENHLTRDILQNAYLLGVGPGVRTFTKRFGSFSKYYVAIKADGVRYGTFDDWEMPDFINFVKKVGGDRRPTIEMVDAVAKREPAYPRASYIYQRFRDVGGFQGIVEMAGFKVTHLWDEDDYIAWGIKFMEANDGILPTQNMLDYMSPRDLSPGAVTVHRKFGKLSVYQTKLMKAYRESVEHKTAQRADHLLDIRRRLASGLLPPELFDGLDVNNQTLITAASEVVLTKSSEVEEIIRRYARYMVVDSITSMSQEAKVEISVENGRHGMSFIRSIRKHRPHITAGDIEHAALVNHVFDVVWPMDTHLTELKLGNDYKEWAKAKKRVRPKVLAAKS